MPSAAMKPGRKYTFADYRQWPENERWELLAGLPCAMATLQRIHQKIVFEMGLQMGLFLCGKSCEAYAAPFSVRLPHRDEADDRIDTVVEPDLSVICDRSKLDRYGCRGAPDWIVEVLSPSTALRDMNSKRSLYEQHGVREYWIVHPADHWIMVYLLDEQGHYGQPQVFGMEEPTPVSLFPELSLVWDFMAGETEV
ncbi:MAG: Uma2 family endonuclease [Thiothrix sp.]|nr:Uma2 family endonuclease [Thiothrix sp.]